MAGAPAHTDGPAQSEEPEESRVRPVPDEDGPHDVPDDAVIEKTLPTHLEPTDGKPGF